MFGSLRASRATWSWPRSQPRYPQPDQPNNNGALKVLLRKYGLRAVSVREEPPEPPPPAARH